MSEDRREDGEETTVEAADVDRAGESKADQPGETGACDPAGVVPQEDRIELDRLSQEVDRLREDLEGGLRTSLELARRLGEKLNLVKEALDHGHFGPWLAERQIKRRSASLYMSIAAHWDVVVGAGAGLTLNDAAKLIAGASPRARAEAKAPSPVPPARGDAAPAPADAPVTGPAAEADDVCTPPRGPAGVSAGPPSGPAAAEPERTPARHGPGEGRKVGFAELREVCSRIAAVDPGSVADSMLGSCPIAQAYGDLIRILESLWPMAGGLRLAGVDSGVSESATPLPAPDRPFRAEAAPVPAGSPV